MSLEYLKGTPSPTDRYTCELRYRNGHVAHMGGQSYNSSVRVGKDAMNAGAILEWCVVPFESLWLDHPFRNPDSAYLADADCQDLERE